MANPEYVQTGEEFVVDAVEAALSSPYIGWGTGTTAPVKGNTGLETPAPEARSLATASQPVADKNRWVATITATGTRTITEAGLFNLAAAGIMLIRGTFAGIGVSSGDKIEFTIDLEQT